jgi:hypothetical protein
MGKNGNIVNAQRDVHIRPSCHLQGMAENAEAGDVGNGMHIRILGEFAADAVEVRRRCDEFGIGVRRQHAFLERCRVNSDTKRLGQDQRVTGPSAAIAPQTGNRAGADDRKAVNRLGSINRMAAGDGDTCFRADCASALQNLAHRLGRQLVNWHAENGECHDRLSAHCINVGNRIGCRNPAEVERIVDHRHEEVRRRDHAGFVIELPDRGIVTGFGSDKQPVKRSADRLIRKQLLQDRGRQLASASATMGKRGQAQRRY